MALQQEVRGGTSSTWVGGAATKLANVLCSRPSDMLGATELSGPLDQRGHFREEDPDQPTYSNQDTVKVFSLCISTWLDSVYSCGGRHSSPEVRKAGDYSSLAALRLK
jgi:hypothetical protein